MSRLDLWLGSSVLYRYVSHVSISAAPLTDHSIITLKLNPENKTQFKKDYWKFNADLLIDDGYVKMVKDLIHKIYNDGTIGTYTHRWEFFKFKVREFSITFSKMKSRQQKEFESKLLYNLNNYCNRQFMSEADKKSLLSLQAQLDDLYEKKAHGAYIRARAKWIEEGEKSTSYFYNLEKRRQEKKSINTLIVNGEECTNHKTIAEEIHTFYSNLYSSKYLTTDSITFFDQIEPYIPKIDSVFREICDSDISLDDLDQALNKLKMDKAPGQDGLTAIFYKFFWKEIKEFFFKTIREIISNETLATTMKQGLFSLIPKPDKDKRLIDNLRPITLLNTDYKILAHVIANRLKDGLDQIISETQSGFLKNRSIHNNIRLVLDLLDYNHLIEDDGVILFLDFYKAFDTVEHPFILKALQYFGFGKKFIDLISLLYSDINSSISLPFGTSKRFNISRGIRQGCPASPLLFIIVTELLAIFMKHNPNIQPLNLMGAPLIISQLADDTTLFLKNTSQVPLALNEISLFSKASGLCLNIRKCELLTIHDCKPSISLNITVKTEIKYLGIIISKNTNNRENLNFEHITQKSKKILISWLQRDLSIFGRVLLTKTEGISRLIYPSQCLYVSNRLINNINQINFNYIWRNKQHYIRKNDVVKSFEEGGLNVIDFEAMDGSIKLKWLQSFINNSNNIWFYFPKVIFEKLGGIEFLLKCDFEISKLPIKLSNFHKQVLQYWKMIYKHNFSPHTNSIWNNRCILIKRKSIFYKDWMDHGIWTVLHLLDNDGNVLSYNKFIDNYGLSCTQNKFIKVVKAIPPAMIQMAKASLTYSPSIICEPSLIIDDHQFKGKTCNNKFLRTILTKQLFPSQLKRKYLFKDYNSRFLTKYLSFPIPLKAKEIHFKVLNAIYPSKDYLHKKFNIDTNTCTFCNTDIETTEHLFYSCESSRSFWDDFQYWLTSKNIDCPSLTFQVIRFGLQTENKKIEFGINNLFIVAKFFIHKCRFLKITPIFAAFKNEVFLLKASLDKCNLNKAHTLLEFLMLLFN